MSRPSPQLHQFLTLVIVFVLGKTTAHVSPGWGEAALLLVFAWGVEHALIRIRQGSLTYISYSSLSTTLGILLMLAVSEAWIYGILILLALVQKHIVTLEGRHFFNPSNFALIVGMVFFYHEAHVVLGQMGERLWLQGVVVGLGVLILLRVERWRIPIVFVVGYLLFEYLWVVGYDPVMTFEDVLDRFSSVAFVVFVTFMLTDPRTTPSREMWQGAFALAIAAGGAMLDRWFGFRVQHLFMVLFLLSVWVPLMEAEKNKRKMVVRVTIPIALLAIGAIIYLELQPPYYFAMDG